MHCIVKLWNSLPQDLETRLKTPRLSKSMGHSLTGFLLDYVATLGMHRLAWNACLASSHSSFQFLNSIKCDGTKIIIPETYRIKWEKFIEDGGSQTPGKSWRYPFPDKSMPFMRTRSICSFCNEKCCSLQEKPICHFLQQSDATSLQDPGDRPSIAHKKIAN